MDHRTEDKLIWYDYIEKLTKEHCENIDTVDINYSKLGLDIAKFFGYAK